MNFIELVKKEKKFLFYLFSLALILRLLVFVFYLSKNQNYYQVDSSMYHDIATSIASGKGISSTDGSPQFYRVPGYPIFLAACYKLFTPEHKIALYIQILLASLIPFLILLLSLVLFPLRIYLGKTVSIFSCFHLGLVLYSGFFMTESLFILFFLLFLILFLGCFDLFFIKKGSLPNLSFASCSDEFCQGAEFINLCEKIEEAEEKNLFRGKLFKFFFAGLFLGIASMFRPVGHYLIVLSIVILLFSNFKKIEKLWASTSLFLGWASIVSLWLIRNFVLTGYMFFHTLPGGHFLNLSASRVAMHVYDCSYWEAREILNKEASDLILKKESEFGSKLKDIEVCDIMLGVATKYFKKYPFLSLKMWATDMLRTSLSLYSSELIYLETKEKIDYFAKGREVKSFFQKYFVPDVRSKFLKIVIYLEILMFLFILLGFFGFLIWLIFNFKYNLLNCSTALKVLPFMALFIVIALSGGYSRMRLPIEPFLMIFSFNFWLTIFPKFKFKRCMT